MAKTAQRAPLVLSEAPRVWLTERAASRPAPVREVERARRRRDAEGLSISAIQRQLGLSRPTRYQCLDKALAAGVARGLKDAYHRPRAPEITAPAKAWVVSLAGAKPQDLGKAAEWWTLSALAGQGRAHAAAAGFPRLAQAGKTTIWRLLDKHPLKPHKITSYLEQRDLAFQRKWPEVLMGYQEVAWYSAGAGPEQRPPPLATVSVDEQPGIPAIGLTAPDLPPQPGQAATVGRDDEYQRLGTVSLLAGIDLYPGQIFARVEDRHRSGAFMGLLQVLDGHAPPDAIMRRVLDQHASHLSQETMAYLATRPGRFE